jgi:hypothetical protein
MQTVVSVILGAGWPIPASRSGIHAPVDVLETYWKRTEQSHQAIFLGVHFLASIYVRFLKRSISSKINKHDGGFIFIAAATSPAFGTLRRIP